MMPGDHQNTRCPEKERLGPYQDAGAQKMYAGCPARCHETIKIPGAHQKKHWVPMKMLGAQLNATFPTRNAVCLQRSHGATKTP